MTFAKHLLSATALAAAISCGVAAPALAGTVTLAGNVAPWTATARHVGTAPAEQRVAVVVYLKLKDTAGLKQLADAVSRPGSPRYGAYLTPAQFRARFAPDVADVTAVKQMLSGGGMTDLTVGVAGTYVAAKATVAQLRTTFGVSQELYSVGGRTLRANLEAPKLPAALADKVVFVGGLDDSALLKHPMHYSASRDDNGRPVRAAAAGPDTSGVTPPPVADLNPPAYCDSYFGDLKATVSTKPNPYGQTLPWLACGYTPQQIQAAYGFNKVTSNGYGVTVAIVDAYASPTLEQDSNRYATNHSLPKLRDSNFSEIIPQGIYDVNPSDPCEPLGWWTEQSLDVAAVHGSAPGAHIVYIGSEDCDESLDDALTDAIYNHTADIITNSWSFNGEAVDPADVTSDDQAFMAAETMGISVLFSSGDDGDLSQLQGFVTGAYPSTSAYVTGVGGTSLALRDSTGTKSEWGWGTYRDYLANAVVNSGTSVTSTGLTTTSNFGYTYSDFAFYSGAGGGVSLLEAQPSYQASVVPSSLSGYLIEGGTGYGVPLPAPQRVAPDIAMDADPYTGYKIGQSFTVAGNYSDTGCVPTRGTQEYCEYDEGGTSLASPLMAGALAVIDEHRLEQGKPEVGFANPFLYGVTGAGIGDVQAPTQATAVLRGYLSNLDEVRVVTINSAPFGIQLTPFALFYCGAKVCEGLDDVFNYTTPGYDVVTGLGTPYIPALIKD